MDNRIFQSKEDAGWIGGKRIELCQQKHVQSVDNQRTNNHTGDTAYTSDDYHRKVEHRIAKTKVIGRYLTQLGGVKSTRDA